MEKRKASKKIGTCREGVIVMMRLWRMGSL